MSDANSQLSGAISRQLSRDQGPGTRDQGPGTVQGPVQDAVSHRRDWIDITPSVISPQIILSVTREVSSPTLVMVNESRNNYEN